ncbi:nucleotidyltransferase [Virgibacillus profundi]|uniref:Nucleotidyltransferase n=1 Tax=Virgibacillus profundi TaxID=2024555 RepID=A0A2A2I9J8_9BACI|nr:nucleotidyltransferase [Virgibacillus profundi]PAV27810.1 nucleotidyltransferase [Virgibacillus profundi]PXY51937.1 nucleotidyltransferase [Virgibacillus profundi]
MGNYQYFYNLLSNIEPSKSTKNYVSSLQSNLREYLKNSEQYKHKHIDTFISGSFAKNIAIRPSVNEDKQDVDIVVVTNYNKKTSPEHILTELKDVLSIREKYKNIRLQSKSVGIDMANYHIDIVPLIAEDNHFWIGNRENNEWILTNPKKHIEWSTRINTDNENKYKPLVKLLKWWRKRKNIEQVRLPKGILLEKLIADNIGNSKYDMENLLITTLENIVDNFKDDYIAKKIIPTINDPILQENNLAENYSLEDFTVFIELIQQDLEQIKSADFSVDIWKKIFGKDSAKSIEETQEEYSLTAKSQIDCLLNEVVEKSQELAINIKEYEQKKQDLEKKETDISNRKKNIQSELDDLKYTLYIDFIQEASNSLSSELIKDTGREYWIKKIETLEEINKKKRRGFRGYEHNYLATIYKALELHEKFYDSICSMVKDNFYLSIYEVKDVIEKTPYRITLINSLKAAIKHDDYSSTNKSFKEALKLLEKDRK